MINQIYTFFFLFGLHDEKHHYDFYKGVFWGFFIFFFFLVLFSACLIHFPKLDRLILAGLNDLPICEQR